MVKEKKHKHHDAEAREEIFRSSLTELVAHVRAELESMHGVQIAPHDAAKITNFLIKREKTLRRAVHRIEDVVKNHGIAHRIKGLYDRLFAYDATLQQVYGFYSSFPALFTYAPELIAPRVMQVSDALVRGALCPPKDVCIRTDTDGVGVVLGNRTYAEVCAKKPVDIAVIIFLSRYCEDFSVNGLIDCGKAGRRNLLETRLPLMTERQWGMYRKDAQNAHIEMPEHLAARRKCAKAKRKEFPCG